MRRLLIRPGAIGDTVVWLPAAAALQPAEIWVPSQNLPLVAHLAPARSIASTGLDMAGLPGYEPPAGLEGFDEIWSWYGANREEFRAAVAHLPFRFFPALPEMWGEEHAVDFFLRHAGQPPGGVPRLPVARRGEGYFAIHPFSGSPKKNWPVSHFMNVASRLKLKGQEVVFICGPEEGLPGARRFEDLGSLMEWLAGARAYIGNDSGPTHIAAALGVPTLALFGPTNPKVWAPRGARVRVMDQLAGPRAVFEALYGLIYEYPPTR